MEYVHDCHSIHVTGGLPEADLNKLTTAQISAISPFAIKNMPAKTFAVSQSVELLFRTSFNCIICQIQG